MRMIRWCLAVLGALAAFGLPWWGWEQWKLPPSGPDRLSVALAIGAVVSAAAAGPLFFWAGRDIPAAWSWGSLSGRGADSSLSDIQRKMRSIEVFSVTF